MRGKEQQRNEFGSGNQELGLGVAIINHIARLGYKS